MHGKWAAIAVVLIPVLGVSSAHRSAEGGERPHLFSLKGGQGIRYGIEHATSVLLPVEAEKTPARATGPSIVVRDLRTPEEQEFRLYDAEGHIDTLELSRFRALLGEGAEVPVRARTIQLLVKAAFHFERAKVIVVSSYRAGRRHGPHGTGAAIDFKLAGISASKLASFLRKEPRVGVGLYTHPKTQFVHLDDRDTSFHWLDGSPPGARWRERPLKDATRDVRDAAYVPTTDLPESI